MLYLVWDTDIIAFFEPPFRLSPVVGSRRFHTAPHAARGKAPGCPFSHSRKRAENSGTVPESRVLRSSAQRGTCCTLEADRILRARQIWLGRITDLPIAFLATCTDPAVRRLAYVPILALSIGTLGIKFHVHFIREVYAEHLGNNLDTTSLTGYQPYLGISMATYARLRMSAVLAQSSTRTASARSRQRASAGGRTSSTRPRPTRASNSLAYVGGSERTPTDMMGGGVTSAARGAGGLNPEEALAIRDEVPSNPLVASAARGAGQRGRSPHSRPLSSCEP